MKTGEVGNSILDDIVVSTHKLKPAKRIERTSILSPQSNNATVRLATSIERIDQLASSMSKKLQDMSNLLNQMESEKSDIVREQLAHFFNVLRAFIEEALRPTGDWSTDQIMSGKSICVSLGDNAFVVQGERISIDSKCFDIHELPESPTNNDIQTLTQNIEKALTRVKKLRNNLTSARAQITHHSTGSSEIIL